MNLFSNFLETQLILTKLKIHWPKESLSQFHSSHNVRNTVWKIFGKHFLPYWSCKWHESLLPCCCHGKLSSIGNKPLSNKLPKQIKNEEAKARKKIDRSLIYRIFAPARGLSNWIYKTCRRHTSRNFRLKVNSKWERVSVKANVHYSKLFIRVLQTSTCVK